MTDDWYGDEWKSLGWTAQKASTVAGPATVASSLPSNFVVVTVTAIVVDDDGPLDRSVFRFTPSVRRVTDGNTIVWLHEVDKRIEKGILSVDLLATDVVGVTPTFFWHVKECFPGGAEYDILVPKASTSPISILSLPQPPPS